jgi:hypothetical protein
MKLKNLKRCTLGLRCGFSCVNSKKQCVETRGGNAAVIYNKIRDVIKAEGVPIAVGVLAGSMTGPLGGTLGTAGTRAVISIGKQAHKSVSSSIAEASLKNITGLKKLALVAKTTISDLKSGAFVKGVEKGTQGDVMYGVISNTVLAIVKVPIIGDVIALKTTGMAVDLLQKFQNRKAS